MRTGTQEPRIRIEPEAARTDGPMASELVGAYGYELDPWQRDVLASWLARDETDSFAATSCGLAVPRQNGKNALLEARELYGLVTTGEKFLHTAHEVKTARKAFMRLAGFFENDREFPELAEMVRFIRRTNGQECIELVNGGSVEFSARSRGAARGFTVDTVVFDEAQELTDEQLEAMLPTLAAAPSGTRQFIYTGTPPGPNSPGEVFTRTRRNAVRGIEGGLSWWEWSVEELPREDASFEDVRESCYEVNPALGYRIDIGFCEREFNALSIDGFARERLGWWSPDAGEATLISPALWEMNAVKSNPIDGAAARSFGVKFAPDGSAVALAVCVRDGERSYVELVDCRPLSHGVGWLADFLCRDGARSKTAAIAVDGRNGAAALLKRLTAAYPGQALPAVSSKAVVDASVMVVDALKDGAFAHWADDGQKALDRSALTSVARKVGKDGGWAFGGMFSTPIEAAALAYWAAATTKRRPGRGCKLL